jgi:hypothetical protein
LRRRAAAGRGEADLDGTGTPAAVGHVVEALHAVRSQAQVVAVDAGVDLHQERLVAVQELADLGQELGKDGDLELGRGVGEDDPAQAGSFRHALLLRDDDPGELQPGPLPAGGERAQPVAASDAEPGQGGGVAVERVGGEVEAQDLELALEAVQGRPVVVLGQLRPGRAGRQGVAEQAHLALVGRALGAGRGVAEDLLGALDHGAPAGVQADRRRRRGPGSRAGAG